MPPVFRRQTEGTDVQTAIGLLRPDLLREGRPAPDNVSIIGLQNTSSIKDWKQPMLPDYYVKKILRDDLLWAREHIQQILARFLHIVDRAGTGMIGMSPPPAASERRHKHPASSAFSANVKCAFSWPNAVKVALLRITLS